MSPLIFGGLEPNDAQVKYDLAGYSVGRRGQPWIFGCTADDALCWLLGPGRMTAAERHTRSEPKDCEGSPQSYCFLRPRIQAAQWSTPRNRRNSID